MDKLKACPFCGGDMQVRMYDEDFYRAVLGTEYECDPEFNVEHVDRLAAAKAKCPFEMECYRTEAETISAWNMRTVESASGHDCMVPTVQDLPNYCPECGAQVIGDER